MVVWGLVPTYQVKPVSSPVTRGTFLMEQAHERVKTMEHGLGYIPGALVSIFNGIFNPTVF